jgi:hypothetical protein
MTNIAPSRKARVTTPFNGFAEGFMDLVEAAELLKRDSQGALCKVARD